jgi:tol-pal system protein YbgF
MMSFMKNIFPLAAIILSMSFAMPVMAQNMDNEANGARIEKLERDIMMLQRQLARSGGASPGAAGAGNADFEVRLSTIEDQLRELLGKTEENDFQIRKLTQNLEKLQKDTDFRFNDLTHATPSASAPSSPAASAPAGKEVLDKPKNLADESVRKEFNPEKNIKSVGKTVDTVDDTDSSISDDSDQTEFSSAREHYNYAFRLLNQTQYDKAAASFAAFTKKYPKDPLIGNAYYWQGETYYIRRDYVNAADSFRQGFEEMPSGPKAPDNLLKLAMSLNALKRDKEACVVLGQVVAKFKKTAAAVSQKAEQEQKRIDCK